MEILVAEDSRTQALRLSADPERRGFQVLVEYGGRRASEATARERPGAPQQSSEDGIWRGC